VLDHVPLGDVALAAVGALERPRALMLAEVHVEVGARIVLLIAPFEGANELENILVCFFMVAQDPVLSELPEAARERANKLLVPFFLVSRHVVGQVLGHLETLGAPWIGASVKPHAQMAL
jgi:hypothetical protein